MVHESQIKSLAIILEKTDTINSTWVWGEEVMARSLAKHLSTRFEVRMLSEKDVDALGPGQHFDVAIHLREKFRLVGLINLLWLHNGLESFHAELTYEEWIKTCILDQVARFDSIASASMEWCKIIKEAGGQSLYFPQFVDCDVFKKSTQKKYTEHFDIVYVSNNIKGESVNEEFLYPLVEQFGSEYKIGIFGDGWYDCIQSKLIASVHRGTIAPALIPSLYSNAKIVLSIHLPSHRKYGIITSRVYEAMACEAIVVSDTVETKDNILQEGCHSGSTGSDLLLELRKALQLTSNERKIKGKRARELVVSAHSAEKRFKTIYNHILNIDLRGLDCDLIKSHPQSKNISIT